MAIQDNLIFRLKPQAGQLAPRNEVGANEVFAGGTFALVDRGSGNFAWELTGVGDTIATIPSITRGGGTGDLTIAVTLKIVTAPTVDFTRYVGFMDAGVTSGHFFGQAGPGSIRGRFVGASGAGDNTFAGIGSTEITLVSRLIGGTSTISGWKTTVSRVGTAPDGNLAISMPGDTVLSKVLLRAAASDVIQVKAFAVWSTAKTDAECASLADNFEATIGAAPPAPAAVNLAISNLSIASTLSTVVVGVAAPVAGVVNLAISNMSMASTLSTLAVTNTPAQGTITSDEFTAYGSQVPLANLTVPHVTLTRMTDRVQVLSLANQVTNGAGRLVLTSASIVKGIWYMLASWNADGTLRGFKAHLAA